MTHRIEEFSHHTTVRAWVVPARPEAVDGEEPETFPIQIHCSPPPVSIDPGDRIENDQFDWAGTVEDVAQMSGALLVVHVRSLGLPPLPKFDGRFVTRRRVTEAGEVLPLEGEG